MEGRVPLSHEALAKQAATQPGLLRALGPLTATALVVGSVIGSGIFLKPGNIAREVGDFRLILMAWVVGGIVCLLGALCLAELATMLPQAGGLYVYLREAYGRWVAFLFGWTEFFFNRTASTGALAVAFTGSLAEATGWRISPIETAVVASLLIAAVAWVNIRGVVWGAGLQTVTTFVKAGAVALIALIPFLFLVLGRTSIDWHHYTTTIPPPEGTTFWGRIGVIFLAVMWAYDGWHQITPVAEEIRDPQRNVPRALFAGVALLIALYVMANLSYHGVLSMQQAADAGEHAAERTAEAVLGPLGASFLSAAIMCSTFGTISNNLLTAPRVPFAMGRDGLFFRALGNVHAVYRTPSMAILAQAVISIALVFATGVLVTYAKGFEQKSMFGMLTDFVVFAAGIFYTLSVVAVMILRRKLPDWPRPYRTWGYPFVPLLFLVFYVWFTLQIYLEKPFEAGVGLALIAMGVPVYWAFHTLRPKGAGPDAPVRERER